MNTHTHEKLFTMKELAQELRRSYRFVRMMRRHGFQMPGGTATITEARTWLIENPNPCGRNKPRVASFG